MTRPFTLIAAVLFTLVALLHVYRIFTHFQIVAGSHTLADWASYVAVVIAAVMAWGLYRESRT
jgi:protein-S-isoprenylcysteine O-methyltransferase Ste14